MAQKWKKQVKASKFRKFRDLTMKTVALAKFLNTEKSTQCNRVLRLEGMLTLNPMQTLIHSVLEFRGLLFLKL